MENNELERKIINNVRNKIVVSNLEKEANMRMSKRRAIISITALVLILMSGSFLTVNAATDGQLAKDVKDLITFTFDTSKYKQTESKEGVDEQGNEYYQYTLESLDGQEEVQIVTYKDVDTKVNYETSDDGEMNISLESDKLEEKE